MTREEVIKLIGQSIKELQKKKIFPKFEIPEIKIEHPEEKTHGDYATNTVMVIAKVIKKNPLEIAQNIKNQISKIKNNILEKVEVAEPGFINFFVSKEYLQKQVSEILKEKESFGKLRISKGQKVNVEFISANPTGPLTLGNGRGGFCGDVLANILSKAGYKITREYYINDIGEQVRKLGHSVIGDSEAVYKGSYIEELRERAAGQNPDEVGEKAAKIILKEMIKPIVKKMGIKFDVWFSEKRLHEKSEVKKVLASLKKKNLVYEKEGALWFKSTQFGDDKDRVLIKEDGENTYFLSDIAYLKNKFQRGFVHLFFFWGADHYGYIGRLKSAAEALGYKKEQIDIIIMQLVAIRWAGERLRMSKREGVYRTIEELIEGLGLDVARFFFLNRSPASHLLFDLDLAKEQSEKNPIYYVQYAHARICSILRKIDTKYKIQNTKYNLLNHPSELELIKQLIRFPEIIEDTAKDYQIQRLPQYAVDLATVFHQFYRDCHVLRSSDEIGAKEDRVSEDLSRARLALVLATKIVLKNTLDLMGISAPEKM